MDKRFDKHVDLHVSEYRREGSHHLPFTWLDVQIWAVYIVVGLAAHWLVSTAVGWVRQTLDPPLL